MKRMETAQAWLNGELTTVEAKRYFKSATFHGTYSRIATLEKKRRLQELKQKENEFTT